MEEEDEVVQSGSAFKSLCGEVPFWDGNLTWQTDFPEFSTCFRKTVLIWGPCSVFWLTLPFHLRYYFHDKNAALSFSKLCLVRFLPTSCVEQKASAVETLIPQDMLQEKVLKCVALAHFILAQLQHYSSTRYPIYACIESH